MADDLEFLPVEGAGDIVEESQAARDDNSYLSNPVDSPEILEVEDRITPDDVEFGTDDPTRSINDTQATPASSSVYEDQGPTAPTEGGAGAGSDDSGVANKNTTRTEIDSMFNTGKIVPQDNILDQYASYTYNASLYLMSPEGYKQLMQSSKKVIPGSQLLIQSGGAPINGRNTYFGNDYYIDKIILRSAITGKGTNAAHNVNTIKMTIIEPNGITLIPNLDKAVQGYLGSAQKKKTNFTSAIYLLVIRFYGYDDAGNLVRGGVARPYGGTDGSAFVEKFYPITISKIDFKVTNKAVEYEIEGTAVSQAIATGSSRGTIPYNVELSGITVKDALTGPTSLTPSTANTRSDTQPNGSRTTASGTSEREDAESNEAPPVGTNATAPAAPPTAGAATTTKLTVRQGLMTALNQFQEDLVKKGTYTVADKYSVEFVGSAIAEAKIQVKNPDKTKGGMPVAKTAADAANPAKQSYDPTSRVLSVTAGFQIVQFIDQVIRNSTYLTDQALVTISEQTGQQTPNGSPGNNVAAYKITMQATPIKYDPKRNDYAYNIKYLIHPYKVSDLISNYYQVPKFNGVHKQYNYWFTGENTQVLNYEQTYNALYTSVLSGGPGQLGGSVVNDAIKANFQPRSGESSQGASGRVNEIGANFTDYLYNPGDLANATLSIIGDPAWLQQGEISNSVGATSFTPGPFMADGTINFESQQIMFEILINTPDDYNLSTGIMDPNTRQTVFQNNKKPGASRQSYVYRANECTSEFSKGKFTQVLKGSLLTYLPDQTFKDQQSLGRPTTNNTRSLGSRNSDSPSAAPSEEWEDQDGLMVLKEDLPSDETNEDDPTSLPDPQPQPEPEDPTSDGDISAYGDQNEVQIAGVNNDSQLMDREA